jgi:Uncharacterized protein conserved in bacteria (DUF2188)
MMVVSREIHVLPCGRSGWSVRREGQVRELSIHPSRAEAEHAGRVRARIDRAPLVVHSSAGISREEVPTEK